MRTAATFVPAWMWPAIVALTVAALLIGVALAGADPAPLAYPHS